MCFFILLFLFLHFIISFFLKYDFHIDAERMKKREKYKEISALMV